MRCVAPVATLRAMLLGAVLALGLAACTDAPPPSALPPPGEVQAESTGHYCGMLLLDHDGPKGQIHLTRRDTPLWFSSVRDTIAFLRLPEEPRDIVAIYVNDMARAQKWDQPEPGAWVDPRKAWFVIDSNMRGGMGAPEAVPFSDRAAAESFQARHQGRVLRLNEIPDTYVLGPVDLQLPTPGSEDGHGGAAAADAGAHAPLGTASR